MKKKYQSKLMECVLKALRIRKNNKYGRKSFAGMVIRCKRAEQTGDYECAYKTLLGLYEHLCDRFAHGRVISDHPVNGLALIHNIPIECVNEDRYVMYATAGVYNLRMMGFPKPAEEFGWRKAYNDRYILHADRAHAHLGELRIITKAEYDSPMRFHPEFKANSLDKVTLSGEHRISFATDSYDDEFSMSYKVVDRGWSKHNHVFIECEGHYYDYCWQFSQG